MTSQQQTNNTITVTDNKYVLQKFTSNINNALLTASNIQI